MEQPVPQQSSDPTPSGPCLTWIGKDTTRRLPLRAPITFLGWKPPAGERPAAGPVKPPRAMVVRSGGAFYVRELAGGQPLTLNGEEIIEADLADGDTLHVDGFRFRFTAAPDAPPPGPMAPPALVRPENGQPPVLLRGRVLVIGSDPGCDLHLDGPGVSPVHAAIVELEGRHILHDFASETGTWLNGQMIKSHPVQDDDVILIGPVAVRYATATPEELEMLDALAAEGAAVSAGGGSAGNGAAAGGLQLYRAPSMAPEGEPSASPRFSAAATPVHHVEIASVPAAAPPARGGWDALGLMVLLMGAAAAAIWFLVPQTVVLQGALAFHTDAPAATQSDAPAVAGSPAAAGASSAAATDVHVFTQAIEAHLRDPALRQSATVELERAHPASDVGFLKDATGIANVQVAWLPSTDHRTLTLLLTRTTIDPSADARRLAALLQAITRAPIADRTAPGAPGTAGGAPTTSATAAEVSRLRAQVHRVEREAAVRDEAYWGRRVDELRDEVRFLQGQVTDGADLQAARRVADLKTAYLAAIEARVRLAAELEQLQGVAPSTRPAGSAGGSDDAEDSVLLRSRRRELDARQAAEAKLGAALTAAQQELSTLLHRKQQVEQRQFEQKSAEQKLAFATKRLADEPPPPDGSPSSPSTGGGMPGAQPGAEPLRFRASSPEAVRAIERRDDRPLLIAASVASIALAFQLWQAIPRGRRTTWSVDS